MMALAALVSSAAVACLVTILVVRG